MTYRGRARVSPRSLGAAVVLTVLATPLFSQTRTDRSRLPQRQLQGERADTVFHVERGTALTINATSAKITVLGWTRDEIAIRGGGTGLQIATGDRRVRVDLRAGRRGRDDDGTMELNVPRGTRILLDSQQGAVEIRDVGGAVEAKVISGDVTIQGSAERSNVSVASGDIHITNAEGPVHVDAISGEIVLEDVHGDVEVSGTSTDLTMRRVRAVRVTANLVSGSVEFDGPLADDGRYEFTTHAGNVKLYLGDGAKGALQVQSFDGTLRTAIPMTTVQSVATPNFARSNRDIRSSLSREPQRFTFGGGGGAQIIVSTFSGDVNITRAQRRRND